MTNRIIQFDYWSLVERSKSGANEDEGGQARPEEHDVVPMTRRGERGVCTSPQVGAGAFMGLVAPEAGGPQAHPLNGRPNGRLNLFITM